MATVVRSKTTESDTARPVDSLDSGVPAPFPREEHQRILLESNDVVPEVLDASCSSSGAVAASTATETVEPRGAVTELMPSIACVQRSCITTLNDLLSGEMRWSPIVPDRRHSMPSVPQSPADTEPSTAAALQTLVSNLRSADEKMMGQDEDLINELRARVDALSPTLPVADAQLAQSLVSLLSNFQRLSAMQGNHLAGSRLSTGYVNSPPSTSNTLDALRRQLSDFQVERLTSVDDLWRPRSVISPVATVETSLLWARIDEELENVVSMCRGRTESLPLFHAEHHPPRYSYDDDAEQLNADKPPEYDLETHGQASAYLDKPPRSPTLALSGQDKDRTRPLDEKMRLDLEAVTMAIDRLYMVAPQLHNQRVELKSDKVKQLEMARLAGVTTNRLSSAEPLSRVARGKQKAMDPDIKDLEKMLDLIGKASSRTLKDQSFVVVRGAPSPLEKTKRRESARREAFVEHLAQHSDAGRLHMQDAELHQHPRTKDPNALLTLPEFMREAIPDSALPKEQDMDDMLTLPEFVKSSTPPSKKEISPLLVSPASPSKKKRNRVRSLSAPSMSWLKSSKSEMKASRSTGLPQPVPEVNSPTTSSNLEVNYVAEYHESLHHIIVFLMVSGAVPGVDLEAEVLPSFNDSLTSASSSDQGDRLIIKSGVHVSLPLSLPGRTTPGKKAIKVQGHHYEIKISTIPSSNPAVQETPPLMDATQLNAAAPTSFICSSCSLPIVQSTKSSSPSSSSPSSPSSSLLSYRDLPSEHWQELVDAWMCHSDQKLTDQVMRHANEEKNGFQPSPGQALVGGSYILFREDAIVKGNIHPSSETTERDDTWRIVRCLCGAVVGRSQLRRQHGASESSDASPNTSVFRILKFAVRPVSQTAEPVRIPLSAFVVEDMNEFVHAHATYRFIILDEEEEKPRLLIWLFKPNIRIAYKLPRSYAITQSASIHAAKVLYKRLGPSESSGDLSSYVAVPDYLDKTP
ncbi:hypothetical protein ONZ45_g11903 [Pleurotus djamor]|nr:hypothetical protein ONZ45_g11903 [Pleurotus djamor]